MYQITPPPPDPHPHPPPPPPTPTPPPPTPPPLDHIVALLVSLYGNFPDGGCTTQHTTNTKHRHYTDVIMTITTMASQITSLTVVYSTVYSDADQGKHHSSASLAFVWGFHRDRWIPRTKVQLRGKKCFHLMTSSWVFRFTSNFLVTTNS